MMALKSIDVDFHRKTVMVKLGKDVRDLEESNRGIIGYNKEFSDDYLLGCISHLNKFVDVQFKDENKKLLVLPIIELSASPRQRYVKEMADTKLKEFRERTNPKKPPKKKPKHVSRKFHDMGENQQ